MSRLHSASRRVGELLGVFGLRLRRGDHRVIDYVAVGLISVLALSLLVASGVGHAALSTLADMRGRATRGPTAGVDASHRAGAHLAAGAQLIAGGGMAYVVDPSAGTVQRVDPASLADVGSAVGLTAPLGPVAIDAQGTLWVAVPALGQVVPVKEGKPGTPVAVGAARDPLALTVAGGTAVVTDTTAAVVAVVDPSGIAKTVNLLNSVGPNARLVVPARTIGPEVPVLARSSHDVFVVNTADGSVGPPAPLNVTTGLLLAPQLLGDRIYVPDQTSGALIVYNTRLRRLEPRIPVTSGHGPLQVLLSGTRLWVIDQDSAAALVVNADGTLLPLGSVVRPSSTPTPRSTPKRRP